MCHCTDMTEKDSSVLGGGALATTADPEVEAHPGDDEATRPLLASVAVDAVESPTEEHADVAGVSAPETSSLAAGFLADVAGVDDCDQPTRPMLVKDKLELGVSDEDDCELTTLTVDVAAQEGALPNLPTGPVRLADLPDHGDVIDLAEDDTPAVDDVADSTDYVGESAGNLAESRGLVSALGAQALSSSTQTTPGSSPQVKSENDLDEEAPEQGDELSQQVDASADVDGETSASVVEEPASELAEPEQQQVQAEQAPKQPAPKQPVQPESKHSADVRGDDSTTDSSVDSCQESRDVEASKEVSGALEDSLSAGPSSDDSEIVGAAGLKGASEVIEPTGAKETATEQEKPENEGGSLASDVAPTAAEIADREPPHRGKPSPKQEQSAVADLDSADLDSPDVDATERGHEPDSLVADYNGAGEVQDGQLKSDPPHKNDSTESSRDAGAGVHEPELADDKTDTETADQVTTDPSSGEKTPATGPITGVVDLVERLDASQVDNETLAPTVKLTKRAAEQAPKLADEQGVLPKPHKRSKSGQKLAAGSSRKTVPQRPAPRGAEVVEKPPAVESDPAKEDSPATLTAVEDLEPWEGPPWTSPSAEVTDKTWLGKPQTVTASGKKTKKHKFPPHMKRLSWTCWWSAFWSVVIPPLGMLMGLCALIFVNFKRKRGRGLAWTGFLLGGFLTLAGGMVIAYLLGWKDEVTSPVIGYVVENIRRYLDPLFADLVSKNLAG